MISYPLNPHLSSELWQYFNKIPILNQELQGNSKAELEIFDITLPNLSFLKNSLINKDFIRTKILVKFETHS